MMLQLRQRVLFVEVLGLTMVLDSQKQKYELMYLRIDLHAQSLLPRVTETLCEFHVGTLEKGLKRCEKGLSLP